MNRPAFSACLPLFLLALTGEAGAIGLGELRAYPELGDRPRLEFDILGAGKEALDPTCFRLRQPQGDRDLPWLKRAVFSVRKGTPPVLEVSSDVPLREPVLQVAIHIACGYDVVREYVLLASPAGALPPAVERPARARAEPAVPAAGRTHARPAAATAGAAMARPAAARTPRRGMPDRLLLSGDRPGGDSSLRLATELQFPGRSAEVQEAQREILRLEFRMLRALQDQATMQLAVGENLRNMEETLGELQRRSAEFAQQLERQIARPPASAEAGAGQVPQAPAAAPGPSSAMPAETPASEWTLYGLLLGALLGVGGWLGWRHLQERRRGAASLYPRPELAVVSNRVGDPGESGGVDLPVEPAAVGVPLQVDIPHAADADFPGRPTSLAPPPSPPAAPLTALATVDEQFEVNPVMELADIMLSFGRVKGAAQALQEFIDHNPQEALQPWIRLLDVYRMADMREEFEAVACKLNQNFNVEILQWDSSAPMSNRQASELVPDEGVPEPMVAPIAVGRAASLEDMPHLLQQICDRWQDGDVVDYLQQLLRDNRGGKRAGLALPVVEEMLFLIEVQETILKI